MTLYLEVTQDEYSLPVIVCDSLRELAKCTGLRANNISSQITKNKIRSSYPRFIKVKIDDEEGDK